LAVAVSDSDEITGEMAVYLETWGAAMMPFEGMEFP